MKTNHPLPWPVEVPTDMLPELRSDHAGETGAVEIYRGILALSRDPALQAFAAQHLATERRHLDWMQQLLPPPQRSRLLPLWRIAGWLTGALPALFGQRAVLRTIDAVENFVDLHYRAQIEKLDGRSAAAPLRELLEACRADELEHRDEARHRLGAPGPLGQAWSALVGIGSRAGVFVASRL